MATNLKEGEKRITKWPIENVFLDEGHTVASLPKGSVLEFRRQVTDHSTFYEFRIAKSSNQDLIGKTCWLSRREVAEDTRPE